MREHPGAPLSAFRTADELPGPEWLQARRAGAAERAADMPLPSTDEEIWRYSRIDELEPDAFEPAAADISITVPDAAGARVARASELDDGAELVRSIAGEPTTAIGLLHDAALSDPVVIDVPAGRSVEELIVVELRGPADGTVVAPHVVVRAGADSDVRVVEVHRGGGAGLLLPLTELRAEQAARLGYLGVQQLATATWTIGSLVVDAGAQASVRSGVASFGGDYARLRTDCRLSGRGASAELLAAFFGDGDQTLDFRTFQDHAAPDTTSELLFKGALGGRSRSVYTGLIRVEKEARGTNAFQTNRNLKLSDDAWAESVPNLEIENNDVRCSHASTVAPIDAEQRFYLESRGVPTAAAERLIVAGFFDEVLVRLPAAEQLASLRAAVAEKLEREVAA